MHRSVRCEAAASLLELALAADLVPALGLVPGHRHVHKPLEEIALGGRGRPPGHLELLVGGEVLARLD